MGKYVCEDCDWRGHKVELLTASHPFHHGVALYGCPSCRNIDKLRTACDEPECWEPDTCGTPIPDGYRRTCGNHVPQDTNEVGA